MQEAPTIISRSMNSVGIIIFEARSMPPRTPRTMTRWVMKRKTTVHTTGLIGF